MYAVRLYVPHISSLQSLSVAHKKIYQEPDVTLYLTLPPLSLLMYLSLKMMCNTNHWKRFVLYQKKQHRCPLRNANISASQPVYLKLFHWLIAWCESAVLTISFSIFLLLLKSLSVGEASHGSRLITGQLNFNNQYSLIWLCQLFRYT